MAIETFGGAYPILDDEFDDLEDYVATLPMRVKDGLLDTSEDGALFSEKPAAVLRADIAQQKRAEATALVAMQRAMDAAKATQEAVARAVILARKQWEDGAKQRAADERDLAARLAERDMAARRRAANRIATMAVLKPGAESHELDPETIILRAVEAAEFSCGIWAARGERLGSLYRIAETELCREAWNIRLDHFPTPEIYYETNRLYLERRQVLRMLVSHDLTTFPPIRALIEE